MNLIPEIRLSVVMEADRSFNRYRVGFFRMVVPFGVRWHGVIDSSVSFSLWPSLLPVFVVVEMRGSSAGGCRKGSFFNACLKRKEGKVGD